MRYPVMTEKHVADRWQVTLKTLRRWRLDGQGPIWHKLFRHVRYHEVDILEFERRSAQFLMTLLGIDREFKPADEDVGAAFDAQGSRHLTAKDIAEAASLPLHIFQDRAERERKQIPHLMLGGNLRLNRPGFCRQSRASYFLSNRSPYEQSTLPRRIQDRGGQTNP